VHRHLGRRPVGQHALQPRSHAVGLSHAAWQQADAQPTPDSLAGRQAGADAQPRLQRDAHLLVGAHGLFRAYASLYLLQAALWAASAVLPPTPRLVLWGLALSLDLASWWWVARYTTTVRPHPEHLPERFGLFTIILLGEGIASVVHALDHGTELHGHAVAAALGGVALTFATWLGYFEVTRAHDERQVEGAAGGRNLRLWAYGHVPIYVGVFSLAAGTVAMGGEAAWAAPQILLYVAGIALIPLGLALLRRAARPAH